MEVELMVIKRDDDDDDDRLTDNWVNIEQSAGKVGRQSFAISD